MSKCAGVKLSKCKIQKSEKFDQVKMNLQKCKDVKKQCEMRKLRGQIRNRENVNCNKM